MKQILLSIRMLLRFKVYTVVNFIGLAISLACVFTITRYIHQENTVDHCYPEYKRICFIERSISDGTKELAGYQSDLEKDRHSLHVAIWLWILGSKKLLSMPYP